MKEDNYFCFYYHDDPIPTYERTVSTEARANELITKYYEEWGYNSFWMLNETPGEGNYWY